MGGDGQALGNKRSLLTSEKQYELSSDQLEKNTGEERVARWRTCPLSLENLEVPLVFDLFGNIFSKKSVLEYLLSVKEGKREPLDSDTLKLNSLSDVCNLQCDSEIIECPITGFTSLLGNREFVGLWPCGHVVSETVLNEEDHTNNTKCPICDEGAFVVKLNPTATVAVEQQKRLRRAIRSEKKRKRERSL